MVYLIGSLRNPEIPRIARKLKTAGIDTFADWFAAGERADDSWQAYEQSQGVGYIEALKRPAAQNVLQFDKRHLDVAKAVVLALPAGKSGFLEFGRALGQGKPSYILIDKEPERWDVMPALATDVTNDIDELIGWLQRDLKAAVRKRR